MMVKVFSAAATAAVMALAGAALGQKPTLPVLQDSGRLTILNEQGAASGLCPLERTSVRAQVSGFGARVTVIQTFVNPSRETIEAVYSFPLPNSAAVDRMRMRIGDRIVEGQIRKREDAKVIYDRAKAAGQTAALLDQERPNLFTQSVANITPGAKVEVEISYVELLKYTEGNVEFCFPMTVGPRYLGHTADPEKVDPPHTARPGTNIDLTVDIDAGAQIANVSSILHKVDIVGLTANRVRVSLARQDEIPNRDFILRYRLAGDKPKVAFLTQTDPRGGFFTLMVMPPQRPKLDEIKPREVIFVMDQSGSQEGFPLEKSKEVTLKMMQTLRPGDTFNVLGFNQKVTRLWSEARANTPENIKQAEAFVGAMDARGGSEIGLGAIEALKDQFDPARLRLVVYNTDGLIGDEAGVLAAIRANRATARMFTFGIGNSVNRYLIDAMAEEGRGDAEYVTLSEQADAAVARFVRRTQTPVLTNLQASFSGVEVAEVQPSLLPDVFGDAPIVIYGRFKSGGAGKVQLSGMLGDRPWSQTVDLDFRSRSDAPAIPILWARKKIAMLERDDYVSKRPASTDAITSLALQFGIMSRFTSFVAVDSRVVNVGGRQRTVRVPVAQADGVMPTSPTSMGVNLSYQAASPSVAQRRTGFAGGGGGAGGGFGGGLSGSAGASNAGAASAGRSKGASAPVAGKPFEDKVAKPRGESEKDRLDRQFQAKVDPKLKKAKGKLDVSVVVSAIGPKLLAALKTAGLTISDSDKALRIVFGTVDASKLRALAGVEGVVRIDPLE